MAGFFTFLGKMAGFLLCAGMALILLVKVQEDRCGCCYCFCLTCYEIGGMLIDRKGAADSRSATYD